MIMVILKPRNNGKIANRVVQRLRYKWLHRVEVLVFSKGILFLWSPECFDIQFLF